MAGMICPKCGAELPENSPSCEVCGARFDTEFDICPDCKTHVKKGALFCPECGAEVNKAPNPVGDFSFIEAAKTDPDIAGIAAVVDGNISAAEPEAPKPAAPAQETVPAKEPEPVSAPEPALQPEAPAAPEQAEPPSAPAQRTPPPPQPQPRPAPGYDTGVIHRRTPPQPQTPYPVGGFSRNAQPPKGSRYAPITTWGYLGIVLLFSIPVVGWIFCIVWACGGCNKVNKRNLARGYILLFVIVVLVLAIVGALLYFFAYSWIEPYINMILALDFSPVY